MEIQFQQHDFSQAVSSDVYQLYLVCREYIESFPKKVFSMIPRETDISVPYINKRVLDLGTGNGILLLMLAKEFQEIEYTGVELLPELTEIARMNLEKLSVFFTSNERLPLTAINDNSLNSRYAGCVPNSLNFNIINADYCNLFSVLDNSQKFDMIMCNPPYFQIGQGKISPIYEKAVARFELKATLKGLLITIRNYLAEDGKAFVIFPISREKELEREVLKNKLQVTSPPLSSPTHTSYEGQIESSPLLDSSLQKIKIFEISHAKN